MVAGDDRQVPRATRAQARDHRLGLVACRSAQLDGAAEGVIDVDHHQGAPYIVGIVQLLLELGRQRDALMGHVAGAAHAHRMPVDLHLDAVTDLIRGVFERGQIERAGTEQLIERRQRGIGDDRQP